MKGLINIERKLLEWMRSMKRGKENFIINLLKDEV